MIIWDDGFFAELTDSCTCVITGRLASGKTLMAVELAEHFLKKGYRLVSTLSCVWNDEFEDVQLIDIGGKGKLRTVAIIDEPGLYFRTQKSASAVASFASKTDTILLFSGKKLPHADLCGLTIQVWFDFMKYFLLPIKVWRYDVENGRKNYSGYFVHVAWWHYFGIYDTVDPGAFPEEIVAFFKERVKQFFAIYGREYKIQDVETGGGDDFGQSVSELGDVVRGFKNATQAIPRKQTFRR